MGDGKHKQIKNKKLKTLTLFFIFCMFIILIVVSSIKIINWIKENKKNRDIIEETLSAVTVESNTEIDEKHDTNIEKYNVNFEKLRQTNNDTVAWLKVNGTNIEYPVVKTSNNNFYMTHSFDKSYNSAGWVFMDYEDKFDGTDKNIVIYAHNRRDGSLFGTLKNILTEDWQNNNNNFIIPFISEDENAEYQVFSVYKIEREDYYITTNFKNNDEYNKFIGIIKSRSIKDFDIEVTNEDKILTISTCADNNKYRIVLHAKKI